MELPLRRVRARFPAGWSLAAEIAESAGLLESEYAISVPSTTMSAGHSPMSTGEAGTTPELDRPASAGALRAVFHAGLLRAPALDAAMHELGVGRDWRRWASLLLLVLGGSLILAGIVFFVAYNWAAWDKAAKLGGLGLAVALAVAGAWWRGLARVEGRALLFAACVLVGVFLAAFGQVYQTGADVWELFRAWAALIVLWVVAARAPVHWLLLLAITDAAISLYVSQVLVGHRQSEVVRWWWVIAATQALTLAGFELARTRAYFYVPQTWPRWVLAPVILFYLSVPATLIVFDDRDVTVDVLAVFLGLVGCILGGYRYYRRVARDLFVLTCIGFCCAWLITMGALRLTGSFTHDNCGSLVLVGLLVVWMLTFLVKTVRRWNVEMREEIEHG